MNGTGYTLQEPGVVRLQDCLGSFPLNRENLLFAIENIKANRGDFATEEAYVACLEKYAGALAFLDGQEAAP